MVVEGLGDDGWMGRLGWVGKIAFIVLIRSVLFWLLLMLMLMLMRNGGLAGGLAFVLFDGEGRGEQHERPALLRFSVLVIVGVGGVSGVDLMGSCHGEKESTGRRRHLSLTCLCLCLCDTH
ncbi:hypothetical protein B0T16DRAFT_79180 [Cercophora newfieldiana]|uniref:Uncharacterized protein n=1 Tax=Cercophora newfieldiana TaxID=92897 RepID=A0AA39YH55_9PEZI|nr:hypothetical protein B0T16DRAFT_79180 [Cercophora newfieldiana]